MMGKAWRNNNRAARKEVARQNLENSTWENSKAKRLGSKTKEQWEAWKAEMLDASGRWH